ncbi:MAG: hypothetical protein OXC83_04010 [Chloroflexi bacterium]|nr:hypothetical protein [Chloroflexota bacterium]
MKRQEILHKYQATQKVTDFLDTSSLTNANTHYANINKSKDVWWLNIAPRKFEQDLHILLVKTNGFIWLRIKANSIRNPLQVFRMRTDKGMFDLEISSNIYDRYLRDIKSGGTRYDFRRHIEHEWDA